MSAKFNAFFKLFYHFSKEIKILMAYKKKVEKEKKKTGAERTAP